MDQGQMGPIRRIRPEALIAPTSRPLTPEKREGPRASISPPREKRYFEWASRPFKRD